MQLRVCERSTAFFSPENCTKEAPMPPMKTPKICIQNHWKSPQINAILFLIDRQRLPQCGACRSK
jgi:hypothetical protein